MTCIAKAVLALSFTGFTILDFVSRVKEYENTAPPTLVVARRVLKLYLV